MNYTRKAPCDNCPFRTDVKPYLTQDRVLEIESSLTRGEFACHKTLEYTGEGEGRETSKTQHCAGALILLEKLERPSQMMRICERLRMYDRRQLKMDSPVYEAFEDMADAQDE